jgi:predicted nucleotidyltransferase
VEWVDQIVKNRLQLLRAGYFGSYARGDWGVGSDLDVILILDHSPVDFHQRSASWDATHLPVPADILIYTEEEWHTMASRGDRFHKRIEEEAVWVFDKGKV